MFSASHSRARLLQMLLRRDETTPNIMYTFYCNKAIGTLNLTWTGFQWNRKNVADFRELHSVLSSPITKYYTERKIWFLGFIKKKEKEKKRNISKFAVVWKKQKTKTNKKWSLILNRGLEMVLKLHLINCVGFPRYTYTPKHVQWLRNELVL